MTYTWIFWSYRIALTLTMSRMDEKQLAMPATDMKSLIDQIHPPRFAGYTLDCPKIQTLFTQTQFLMFAQ